jgi:hypothetical protein
MWTRLSCAGRFMFVMFLTLRISSYMDAGTPGKGSLQRRRTMDYRSLLFKCFSLFFTFVLLGCTAPKTEEREIPTQEDIALASPYPTLEEMVGISPCIFTGTAVGIRYAKHETSHYPYTFVRFAGIEFIKEYANVPLDKDGTLEISYVGGMLDDMSILEISTRPDFECGKRYLVFLRGGGWRLSPIPGINQGLFLLRGRADGDPFVLDISGAPISGFENGYRILSTKKLPEGEAEQRVQDSREEEVSPEKAREMGIIPKRMSPEEVEKIESEAKSREEELDKKEIPGEPGQTDRLEHNWSKVTKLSELTSEIKALVEKTRGKYEKFEKVYFVPVPFAEEGKFEPLQPQGK